MKINDVSRLAQMQSYQKTARQQNAASGSAARTARDGVSISPEAMQMARDISSEVNTDRAERIQSVKAAIQNGTYDVEPSAVAQKLMQAYGEF
jgi:negative regulator of flagellin synthesis FlgM